MTPLKRRTALTVCALAEHARSGGPVVGICNGFQVLCEAGLLPGALQKNAGLKFMPMTPARTTAGRAIAETRVRTFMTSFVRCDARPR